MLAHSGAIKALRLILGLAKVALVLLADYPCLTSSHWDPSATLSSDRVKAAV